MLKVRADAFECFSSLFICLIFVSQLGTSKNKLPQNTIDSMKKTYQRKILNRKNLDTHKTDSESKKTADFSLKREGHYAKMQRHHAENDPHAIYKLMNVVDHVSVFPIFIVVLLIVVFFGALCFPKKIWNMAKRL